MPQVADNWLVIACSTAIVLWFCAVRMEECCKIEVQSHSPSQQLKLDRSSKKSSKAIKNFTTDAIVIIFYFQLFYGTRHHRFLVKNAESLVERNALEAGVVGASVVPQEMVD